MSEVITEAADKEDKAAASSKRKVLSFGERLKIIDYLRAQPEPIVADSNTAVATLVSSGSGVEIGWQQLKYMIDDESLQEYKLGSKVHVRTLLTPEGERVAALESRLAVVEERLSVLAGRIDDGAA